VQALHASKVALRAYAHIKLIICMGILRSGVADFTRLKVFNDTFEVRYRRSFQRATKLWTIILSEISSVMRQAGSKIMRAARLMHHLLARHCIDFKEYDTRLHFNLITITSHLFLL
jgi:hypothetical protein